ncbi:MAG: NAD-dependent epimerase/dehydratase family protein, partial [Bacteroidetes bacterium]
REAFDLVIHNAGLVTAPSREAYFRVNTEYTRRLWAACLTAPTPPRKFLFISSLAAWGPASDDPADRISLTTPPNPITAYGESKLAAERFLMEDAGLPYLIFRPTVVYGPRERDLFTFFKMVKRGLQPVVGFGPQYLSFVFVRDLVRLVLDGALSSLENRAYFVADGQTYSPEELGRLTREILQVRALSFRVPIGVVSLAGMLSEWLARRAGRYPILNRDKVAELKARNWQCDIQPLVQDFGFQPRYTLQEGLQITLDWYRQQGWL